MFTYFPEILRIPENTFVSLCVVRWLAPSPEMLFLTRNQEGIQASLNTRFTGSRTSAGSMRDFQLEIEVFQWQCCKRSHRDVAQANNESPSSFDDSTIVAVAIER